MLARFKPKHLYTIVTVTGVTIVLLLTLFQLRFWIGGPRLEIIEQHYTTTNGLVNIVFQVYNTEQVLINGSAVVPQLNGLVEKTLTVQYGKSVTSIDLYDKYGSHKREHLYIVYPQNI